MSGLSKNKAVTKAYEEGTYTDKNGVVWRRGMDGWFDDDFPGGIFLSRHHNFVEMVEKEHPEDQP